MVVGLCEDNMRDEEERKGRVLKGERGFEFVGNNDGDGGGWEDHVAWPFSSPDVVPCDGELQPRPRGSRTQGTDPQRLPTTR